MIRKLFLAIVLGSLAEALLPQSARPQQPQQPAPLHDIAWYASHAAQRKATLRWCHASSDRPGMFDCMNAEAGADAARAASPSQPRSLESYLNDPAYWRANPYARLMIQGACAHPNDPGSQIYLPWCKAAQ